MSKDLLKLLGLLAAIVLPCLACVWWMDAEQAAAKKHPDSPFAVSAGAQASATDAAALPAGTRGSATEATGTASNMPPAADNVAAARVNGEPITCGEIRAGIREDLFGPMVAEASQQRLDLLIKLMTVRQYLATQGVEVAQADVEREVARLRQNPPASGGCPCCSFPSLDAALSANFMTLDDLRHSIHNDIGMAAHVAALWNAACPPGEKRDTLTSKARPRIEQDYERVSHIFFNTAQQPDFADDPDKVRARVKEKALAAWQRLQAGEEFSKVARERSEDSISRPKGGSLGCVQKSIFGDAFEKALEALEPGACSKPVESPWGFHIVRREHLTVQDILDILQGEYANTTTRAIYDAIQKSAKIERAPF